MKYWFALILGITIISCGRNADMYDASDLSLLMRDMEAFSKEARKTLLEGGTIEEIPEQIWDLQSKEATRGEHLENNFQGLTNPYLEALKGIQRGDSQLYFYNQSIDACRTCHNSYCGGPLVVINQLNIHSEATSDTTAVE